MKHSFFLLNSERGVKQKMIELKLTTPKDPEPIVTAGETDVIANPGTEANWCFTMSLKDNATKPITVKYMTGFVGPGLNPLITILPHLHFRSEVKHILDGEEIHAQSTFILEPGKPRKLEVVVELNDECPWEGLLILQVDPSPV